MRRRATSSTRRARASCTTGAWRCSTAARACSRARSARPKQAMRVAERLDPNDGDVAVLDAEVALAKGYEEKVVAGARRAAADAAQPGGARPRAGADAEVPRGARPRSTRRWRAVRATRSRSPIAPSRGRTSATPSGAIKELEKAATTLSSTAPRYGLGLLAYERHDLGRAQQRARQGARAQLGVVPRARAPRPRAARSRQGARRRSPSSTRSSARRRR